MASFAMLPALPEQVATHWNLEGQPNGWSDKLMAAFMLPALMLGLAILLDFLPRLDPRHENIAKFSRTYEQFILALLFLFALLHLGLLCWAVGLEVPPLALMSVGLALMFFALSRMLAEARPNFTIGMRTPWALVDDANWYATNQLASTLYMWSVPISLLGLLMPPWALLFVLLAAIGPAIISCAYSYMIYAQGMKTPGQGQTARSKKAKAGKRK